ncbi:myrosinase 1-like [Eupeodes corollae]|uniref:myrosinase 1-like n=1 Tax=Eupeodes corollae TaxID=290404 RepID=UPI00249220AC|nr:myrosinase 1-like [Eupeodes corollae]
MCSIVIILIIGILVSLQSLTQAENCSFFSEESLKFPKDFSFGVSTSAYQIEGAWNADNKGPSIWDVFTHNHQDKIKDESNGDIALDSYNNFDLDLKALKHLNVDFYRFSIAWTRIYPNGDISSRNQKGIDYYNNMIDKILANGIKPVITMYHWDLPYEIQKFGGFTNSLIVEQFLTYAEELFENFGDRVKTWITFNEPNQICKLGYGIGVFPPAINLPGVGDYLCYFNLLKAHGATYRLYQSKFFEKQGGKVGITLDTIFGFSKTNNNADVDRIMQYSLGLLAHPIYSKSGGFPKIMVEDIQKNSLQEGRRKSRLPIFDEFWRTTVQGSADFLGLNYYTSRFVRRAEKPCFESPSMDRDADIETSVEPEWLMGKSEWLYSVPEGLEGLLKYIRDEYNNVEVMITENGWSDDGELEDDNRVRYFKNHIQAVMNAVNEGCNVTSYSAWTLVDNFEWLKGYTEKFGLYSVDLTSEKKERIPKNSALFYKNVIETRTIPCDS